MDAWVLAAAYLAATVVHTSRIRAGAIVLTALALLLSVPPIAAIVLLPVALLAVLPGTRVVDPHGADWAGALTVIALAVAAASCWAEAGDFTPQAVLLSAAAVVAVAADRDVRDALRAAA